ncbi:MAG TPA: glycoside hydrolase family 11 protein [Ruminococcus sp.]|nr:glycoside hydrolase family 11 protein [Ruminococcus sp.]
MKGNIKKLVSGMVTGIMCLSAIPVIPAANPISANAEIKQNWTKDGYDFEMWSEYNDNVSMTPGSSGTFTCSWNNSHNCLFRAGKKFSNSPTWSSLGSIAVTYDVDYRPNGNSYLCIYGWTRNPLVEYYIVDSYGTWRPPGEGPNMKKVGTTTVDGATYEIYSGTHDGPSIEQGVTHFNQYWSVRDGGKKRTSGTINVDKHFAEWEKHSMKMGGMYEVALNVEGWESSGQATVKKNVLTMGEDPIPDPDPDPDPLPEGVLLYSSFDKTTSPWSGRGGATIEQDKDNYYAGGNGLYVSGRTETWNGAELSLDSTTFVPGKTYSFSGAVLQKSGSDVDMKLTLQYSLSGKDNYDEIALKSVKSGQWTDLSNTSFTIPSGAENLVLYFEAPDDKTDFYVDEVTIAEKGKASSIVTGKGYIDGKQQNNTDPDPDPDPVLIPNSKIRGDFDGDNKIDGFDLALAREYVLDQFAGTTAKFNMNIVDLNGDGSFNVADIVALSKFILGNSNKFAEPVLTTTTTAPKIMTTTTTTTKGGDSSGYMKSIANDMQINAPSNFNSKRSGVDYGKIDTVTYYSKDGKCDKKMKVVLPAGYSSSEKYPVLYVLHGIGGNEQSMIDMGVQTMLGNLLADGKCEKMIIVCPNMLTGQGGGGFGFDQETMRKYDLIREDIENSIMPYMEEHYSVKTGRENTAITGFSLGGREALYTGITRSELYGYVGGACSAPGIFPTTDNFMTHEGSLKQTSQFKPSVMPIMILMSAAANDSVVAITENYPETYHKALQSNNVEHLWQVIPQGDHGGATVTPHMYNFLRYVFKG